MACSKEYLCLKLQDHIKIKSHGDRRAVFPSFSRIICSGCCAVAVFSLRSDDFGCPLAWECRLLDSLLSGRTSLPRSQPPPGHVPSVLCREGSLTKALFSPRSTTSRAIPASVHHRSRERDWALLGFISPSLPHWEDPKDTSQYTSCT